MRSRSAAKSPEPARQKRTGNCRPRGHAALPDLAGVADSLQRTLGNQVTGRLLAGALVQPKLRVGRPGDRFEREADRVAEQVMRMPEPDVTARASRRVRDPSAPDVQRLCPECAEESHEASEDESDKLIQPKPAGAGLAPSLPEDEDEPKHEDEVRAKTLTRAGRGTFGEASGAGVAHEVLRAPGRPLDPTARAFFEPRFGRDLSAVRVHTGAEASAAARAVHARAFTHGRDIVFGGGQYAPRSPAGHRLIAHELTHVVQQRAVAEPAGGTGDEVADKRAGQADVVGTGSAAGEDRAAGGGLLGNALKAPATLIQGGFFEWLDNLFGGRDFSDRQLHEYLRGLRERGAIEGGLAGDNKARALVRRWKTGSSDFVLTPALITLLIREMLTGFVFNEDEQGILDLLRRSENATLAYIFGPGGIRLTDLDGVFHGEEAVRLRDFVERRFRGGWSALLRGRVDPVGAAVPLGELERAEAHPGDTVLPAQCSVKAPENCHTFESWIRLFRDLPTFPTPTGTVLGGGAAPEETATDPNAPEEARRAPILHERDPYREEDRFIQGPTERWVRENLPPHLVETAYQLPADCADMAVILRHVWLVAHRRSETYRGWQCGAQLSESRSRHVRGLIVNQIYSGNIDRIVRPYTGPDGQPIRDVEELKTLLHPGDVLVWQHQDQAGNATGGHVQTVMQLLPQEAEQGRRPVTRIRVLQGNQPIGLERAEAIRERDRTAPSVEALREAPGRRIEVSELSGRRLQNENGVWTWPGEPGGRRARSVLVAAGPPTTGMRPAARARRRGEDVVRGLKDWTPEIRRAATVDELQARIEAALLEARSLFEGGHEDIVSEAEARVFAHASGERLWQLVIREARNRRDEAARAAQRRGAGQTIADAELRAEDLAEESHFRPLQRILGMIEEIGARSRSRRAQAVFAVMPEPFERAARGATTISFSPGGRADRRMTANVLLTGFDPFESGREPRQGRWNPSAAAVLQLDGESIDVDQRTRAAVEGIVLPVDYAAFRAGIVERIIQPHLANTDAVITISLDPKIEPAADPEIERFAVGTHRLNNGVLAPIPPAPGSTEPGPAIIEARGDVSDIAAEAELPPQGRESETAVTLRFPNETEADASLVGLGLPPQGSAEVVISRPAAIRQIVQTMNRGVQSMGITFRAGDRTYQAIVVTGPGGAFLSNEVSFRVLRLIANRQAGRTRTSFHVHTPRGTAGPGGIIPQEVGEPAQRQARLSALGVARGVLDRLVAKLKLIVKSVARRVVGGQAPPSRR